MTQGREPDSTRNDAGADLAGEQQLASTGPPTGISAPLLASTVIAALGGLLFGFDTAVISGTACRTIRSTPCFNVMRERAHP